MSPELLDPEGFGFKGSRPTKESDCYALGMVMLEVLSGRTPFLGDRDLAAMLKATSGEPPKRPEQVWFTDDVWGMLKSCWSPKPRNRPSLEAVRQSLEEASPSWPTLSHSIFSTADSPKRELPDQDVSWGASPFPEAMTQFAQELTIRGASSGPDHTQVWTFICPLVPALTPAL